jgi:hypothetical protein
MERHAATVARRDDAQARRVALLVWGGRYDEAIQLMTGRPFAVWEGASLSVAEHWIDAHLLRGHQHLQAGRPGLALADYQAARAVPDNLPSERRGTGARDAEFFYWIGTAEAAEGNEPAARASWEQAADLSSARDEQRYFQGAARRRLGHSEQAASLFRGLLEAGEQRAREAGTIDYFASFGEQQSQRARLAQGHFLRGLGHLGLGEEGLARAAFAEVLAIRPDHLGARMAQAH